MPGSWENRRRFMFLIALFCVTTIGWVLYREMDTRVAETAVTMSFVTLISIVGSYVFGATWDDKNARSARS